ncbi:Fibronectin type III domain-containing protein 7 [Merluccius polli]|uniref:Fibronectin type III domain-containing protein 7 n=1 Tax=Merluccius polli TaxID=89951 RepID=A0AA47LZ57_MERPO|nr:Fibronectin type III domain-containing protein 7 [Merluccius polli]
MDCATKEAAVSWKASQGVLSYAVSALSEQQDTAACVSTGPGCTLSNLRCGRTYRVQVLALDNICSSLPSRAAMLTTEPCQPNITAAVLDCYTDSALLDWTHSEGAVSYATTARAANGDAVTCTTNSTNCELAPLECGQTYTVTTVASNPVCDSDASASVQLDSVPCAPTAVVTEQDCAANTALVSWQPGAGADSYLVQAFGVEEHEVSCESGAAARSCLLPGLQCGFTYNITVLAVNSECNVSESAVTVLHAAPCVPSVVLAYLDCQTDAVSVAWEASKGAVSYTTVAQGNGGYSVLCNSSGSTCQFASLPCGLSYNVTVAALGVACSSAESAVAQIDTGNSRAAPQPGREALRRLTGQRVFFVLTH